jgi:hypothetical protein
VLEMLGVVNSIGKELIVLVVVTLIARWLDRRDKRRTLRVLRGIRRDLGDYQYETHRKLKRTRRHVERAHTRIDLHDRRADIDTRNPITLAAGATS